MKRQRRKSTNKYIHIKSEAAVSEDQNMHPQPTVKGGTQRIHHQPMILNRLIY